MPEPSLRASPLGLRIRDFLVDHRIRLSLMACCLSVGLGLALGMRPRDVTGYRAPATAGGLVLILCGLGLRSWAAGTLHKGQALTTTGPYRLCRHPLYLGTLLLLSGCTLIFPALLPSLGLVAVLSVVTLHREERRLKVKYGAAWEEYAARTWRLLPLRLPGEFSGEWRLAQWLRSREYNAVGSALAVIALLTLWQELRRHLGNQ